MDERIKTLAENLVNYSCQVKAGDRVYIHYTGESTKPLAKELVKSVYRAGMYKRADGAYGQGGRPGNVQYGLLYRRAGKR